MKNIAIPLLVAGSANAQLDSISRDQKQAMAEPIILIAAEHFPTNCVNDAVTDQQVIVKAAVDLVVTESAKLTLRSADAVLDSPEDVLAAAIAARKDASEKV